MRRALGSLLGIVALTLAAPGAQATPNAAKNRGGGFVMTSPATGVGVGSVWGVFVGISQFENRELTLSYADADAISLHRFFSDHFGAVVPADHFKLLTNAGATRKSVIKTLNEVFNRAMPEDIVVVFLATHGLPDSTGQDLVFFTANTDPNTPEADGISRDDLLKAMSRSKARKMLLMLDACHAGGFGSAGQLLAMRSANAAEVNNLLRGISTAQDGIAVLTSSSAAERSQEAATFCGGHGAFTCAVLETLKAGDANGNGYVEIRELFDGAYRMTKQLTGGLQNPALEGRYDNALPIVLAAKPGAPAGAAAAVGPVGAVAVPNQSVDTSDYDKLLASASADKARAQRMDQAWGKVSGIATDNAVPKDTRVSALDKFETDFGKDTPFAGEVSRLRGALVAYVPPPPVKAAPAISSSDPLAGMEIVALNATAIAQYKGCKAGNGADCTNLGYAFDIGKDVPVADDRAAVLYRMGCDLGNAVGCKNVGWMYEAGHGIAKDPNMAVVYYRKSCEGDHAQGCSNLGFLYRDGTGIAQDPGLAIALFRKGCDMGDPYGCRGLGWMYESGTGTAKDFAQAFTYYTKGCEGGEALACNNLGWLYESGQGAPKDIPTALSRYQSACDKGNELGCFNVGVYYQGIRGSGQNDVGQAKAYYQRACDKGHGWSCEQLKKF
jgi:TPR repeat protein/uncharacterized caspase-like protein